MIKKFNEFLKESEGVRDIQSILSKEDVDDQFLRLKEVLGCGIKWYYEISEKADKAGYWSTELMSYVDKYDDRISAYIISGEDWKKKEVEKEIYQIKNRMESMYPEIEFIITSKPGDYDNPTEDRLFCIKIELE